MIRAFGAVLICLLLAPSTALAEVRDTELAADALAAAYMRLGGRASLGPILGPAFRRGDEPFLYLPVGRAVLQAPLDSVPAVPTNAMDWLSEAGLDPWLDAVRGIPPPRHDPTRYPTFADANAARRAWLTEPAIGAYYDANGADAALQLYGLPTSLPERRGPFVAQRFQRAALQLWLEGVPGMPPPGTVVPVNVGELLEEADLLPDAPVARLPRSVAPGEVLTRSPSADAVAITIDMGSIDTGLAGVLQALASRGLRATFFLTGDFVARYPWALPRLIELGHEIANHTITHPDLRLLTSSGVAREVDELDARLAARGAPPPVWFRPPFGAYDRRVQGVLASYGYPLVMWRLDLADWRDDTSADDVIRIARRMQAGDVVVTHGGLPKTAAALPQVLDELAARGLRQVTLAELYGVERPPARLPVAARLPAPPGPEWVPRFVPSVAAR